VLKWVISNNEALFGKFVSGAYHKAVERHIHYLLQEAKLISTPHILFHQDANDELLKSNVAIQK
jgi:hypothetical protein